MTKVLVGVDLASTPDMAVVSYQCSGCFRWHHLTKRPAKLPFKSRCICGRLVTIDDENVRALPVE